MSLPQYEPETDIFDEVYTSPDAVYRVQVEEPFPEDPYPVISEVPVTKAGADYGWVWLLIGLGVVFLTKKKR